MRAEEAPGGGDALTGPARDLVVPVMAALLAIGVAGMATYLDGSSPPAPPSAPRNPLAPAPPPVSAFSWRLTAAMSAHSALVLEVETAKQGEAVAIAGLLTESYKDRFDEVLVYFFEPDGKPRLAFVRVQWTRAHGYRTLALRALR